MSLILLIACREDSPLKKIFTPEAYRLSEKEPSERALEVTERLEEKVKDYAKKLKSGEDVSKPLSSTHLTLAEKYLELNRFEDALKNIKATEYYGNRSGYVYYITAAAYANLWKKSGAPNDLNNAESNYRKSLQKDPSLKDSWYGLSILLFYEKKTDESRKEAIGILSELSEKNRHYYRPRFALGRFYYETGELDRALASYESLYSDLKSVKSNPLIEEYKTRCNENIRQIMSEITAR